MPIGQTGHLDGKRTGRPKGAKGAAKSKAIPSDIQWVLDNLYEDPKDKAIKPRSKAVRAMWVWAMDNKDKFMSRVMSIRFQKEEEKPAESEVKEPCVALVDEMIASFSKEK